MPEAMLVDAGYAGVVEGRAQTVYLSSPSCLVLWVLAKRRFRPAGLTGQRRKEASTLWRLPWKLGEADSCLAFFLLVGPV